MNTAQLYLYKYETECDQVRNELGLFMGKGLYSPRIHSYL